MIWAKWLQLQLYLHYKLCIEVIIFQLLECREVLGSWSWLLNDFQNEPRQELGRRQVQERARAKPPLGPQEEVHGAPQG